MKAVSSVIATILMLMIVIALAGSAYFFFSGFFMEKTAQIFSITDSYNDTVTIINDGTVGIESISATVDGEPVPITLTPDIGGLVGYWKFDEGGFCVRDDDDIREGAASGDSTDDGAKKWLIVDVGAVDTDNAILWVHGRAIRCNSTADSDYRLRINDDPSKEVTFNWCDMFGLDTGSSLVDSGWEWKKLDIPKSWLVNGENSITFWDIGGTCSYRCANWNIGVDVTSFENRSGWCCNCGQGSNPPTINKNDTGTCGETRPGELMMFLSTNETTDSSGQGGEGTLRGEVDRAWTSGKFGSSLEFDGFDDYVNIPDSNSLDVTTEFTLSLWVYPLSDPDCDANNNWRWLVNKGGWGSYHALFEEDRDITGTVKNSTGYTYRVRTTPVPLNEWTHYALVYASSTGTLIAYLNGIPNVQRTFLATTIRPDSNNLYINDATGGIVCPTGDGSFNGIIDDVRIYSRNLTEEEIRHLSSALIMPGQTATVGFLTPLTKGTHTMRLCTPTMCAKGYLTII